MNLKKLTTASLLISLGVVSSHIIYIPIGAAKAFPIQHCINLLSAILLGPTYAVLAAFITSLLRNILATGSLLAFPGSMIGAFLAGILFKKTGKPIFAMFGEVFGTGIIGGLASYPIVKIIMGQEAALFFFVGPFAISSLVGAIIGYFIFKIIAKTGFVNFFKKGVD